MCKFPPGHRIRIKRFVELVKEKNREPESKMTFHIKQSKRMKYTADDDSSASEQLVKLTSSAFCVMFGNILLNGKDLVKTTKLKP